MPNRAASPCTFCGKPAVNRGRCERHKRQSTTERGYDNSHQGLRVHWLPIVAAGKVRCGRCNLTIDPAEPWDLGHDDNDRSRYNGPEHRDCNRSAAAKRQMSR